MTSYCVGVAGLRYPLRRAERSTRAVSPEGRHFRGAHRPPKAYHIMEKRPQHDALVKFIGTLPGRSPPSRENDEETIRANLRLWSNIGTGP